MTSAVRLWFKLAESEQVIVRTERSAKRQRIKHAVTLSSSRCSRSSAAARMYLCTWALAPCLFDAIRSKDLKQYDCQRFDAKPVTFCSETHSKRFMNCPGLWLRKIRAWTPMGFLKYVSQCGCQEQRALCATCKNPSSC